MPSRILRLCCVWVLVLCGTSPEPAPPQRLAAADGQEEPDASQFKPRWQVGDRWTIETQTLQLQATDEGQSKQRGPAVPWEFRVQGQEKVGGRDCFRVDVTCLAPGAAQPRATLWVDAKAMVLRQLQTQLLVGGQWRTLTESYQFTGEQPAPVISPLTALPVELPLLIGGRVKGLSFNYEAIPGPAGTKALDEVAFAFDIKQDATRPSADYVKSVLHHDFTKSLEKRPVLEVRLQTCDRQVKQLWQADLPWPAYSDNGSTVSRLVKVSPASPSR